MPQQPESRRKSPAWTLLTACLLLLVAIADVAPSSERDERATAESELARLVEDIRELQRQLQGARQEHAQEQARLRQVDMAIQKGSLDFRELESQRSAQLQQLEALEGQRLAFIASLGQRTDQLAEQLRSAYRSGRQSRLKLVLNQDDPVALGRLLAYYDYLNRAQLGRISDLRDALARLDELQRAIDRELERLAVMQRQQRAILDDLERQRDARRALLGELASRIGSDEAQLLELERNRRDLEALIERLADALADIPADLGTHLSVARQKGRLAMPLTGPVQHAFGQRRTGGSHWQGWLIAAEPGAEVRAVAYGRVAFADWLRGYGMLIIIDHGEGFMSLYGQNESLLAEAGAWVEPGEPIGLVASNPGTAQGLYFELRRAGKALDPAAWIAR